MTRVLTAAEAAVDAEGVEDVVGLSKGVACGGKLIERYKLVVFNGGFGYEASYYRIRNQCFALDEPHLSVRRGLVADAIEHDHLSLEVYECSKPEVAVLEEPRDLDCTLVQALDEGGGGGNLKKSVQRLAEIA